VTAGRCFVSYDPCTFAEIHNLATSYFVRVTPAGSFNFSVNARIVTPLIVPVSDVLTTQLSNTFILAPTEQYHMFLINVGSKPGNVALSITVSSLCDVSTQVLDIFTLLDTDRALGPAATTPIATSVFPSSECNDFQLGSGTVLYSNAAGSTTVLNGAATTITIPPCRLKGGNYYVSIKARDTSNTFGGQGNVPIRYTIQTALTNYTTTNLPLECSFTTTLTPTANIQNLVLSPTDLNRGTQLTFTLTVNTPVAGVTGTDTVTLRLSTNGHPNFPSCPLGSTYVYPATGAAANPTVTIANAPYVTEGATTNPVPGEYFCQAATGATATTCTITLPPCEFTQKRFDVSLIQAGTGTYTVTFTTQADFKWVPTAFLDPSFPLSNRKTPYSVQYTGAVGVGLYQYYRAVVSKANPSLRLQYALTPLCSPQLSTASCTSGGNLLLTFLAAGANQNYGHSSASGATSTTVINAGAGQGQLCSSSSCTQGTVCTSCGSTLDSCTATATAYFFGVTASSNAITPATLPQCPVPYCLQVNAQAGITITNIFDGIPFCGSVPANGIVYYHLLDPNTTAIPVNLNLRTMTVTVNATVATYNLLYNDGAVPTTCATVLTTVGATPGAIMTVNCGMGDVYLAINNTAGAAFSFTILAKTTLATILASPSSATLLTVGQILQVNAAGGVASVFPALLASPLMVFPVPWVLLPGVA